MTSGSLVADSRVSVPYTIDGVPAGAWLSGRYSTRSWSGTDGTASIRQAPKRRVYTTLDRRTGKVVRRVFRERSPRRSVSKEPHSYSMTSFKFRAAPWNSVNSDSLGNVQTLGNYSQPVSAPLIPTLPDWTTNDDIKLINKLKEKSRGSDFNAAIFLAQGNEALHMIGDSAIRIARAMVLLRKGNVVGAVHELSKSAKQTSVLERALRRKSLWSSRLRKHAADRFSSNWLELQYGWLPLLHDIRSGAELAADKLNVPMRQRVVARHSVKKDGLEPIWSWGYADGHSIRSKQIVAYFSEPESIPKLLGVTDPASVAWELLPFSFVVDWFLPIGDWLEARAYASDLVGTFVTTTFNRQLWSGIRGRSYDAGSYTGVTVVSGGDYYCSIVAVDRSVGYTLPIPPPAFKPLSKALSWQHAVNGLALLAQTVFKGSRI